MAEVRNRISGVETNAFSWAHCSVSQLHGKTEPSPEHMYTKWPNWKSLCKIPAQISLPRTTGVHNRHLRFILMLIPSVSGCLFHNPKCRYPTLSQVFLTQWWAIQCSQTVLLWRRPIISLSLFSLANIHTQVGYIMYPESTHMYSHTNVEIRIRMCIKTLVLFSPHINYIRAYTYVHSSFPL